MLITMFYILYHMLNMNEIKCFHIHSFISLPAVSRIDHMSIANVKFPYKKDGGKCLSWPTSHISSVD